MPFVCSQQIFLLKKEKNDTKEINNTIMTVSSETKTLYQRLGGGFGDSQISVIVENFFDEIVENEDVAPFFKNISVSALKTHQVKLFKVIFGPADERPDPGELFDFMLATHTRLFRDLGLNEHHFDKVATCLVQGLQSIFVEQDVIDECVAILLPLRAAFEYGAKVAENEKNMTKQQLSKLPVASFKTTSDVDAVLPEPCTVTIPEWLPQTLAKYSSQPDVRAWTCALTDRFGTAGDLVIADTFLDQTYMYHHVYNVNILILAFLPSGIDPAPFIKEVKFPRGLGKEPLSLALWERMMVQFRLTCISMWMENKATEAASAKLMSYNIYFPAVDTIKVVNGITAPHVLRRVPKVEIEFNQKIGKENKKKKKSRAVRSKNSDTGSLQTSLESESVTSYTTNTSNTTGIRKVELLCWRRMFFRKK
jgi:truncated hemoglobin YjbI